MPMLLISLLSMSAARAQSPAAPNLESGSPPIAAAEPQAPDRPEPPGLGKQILGGMAYGSGGLLLGGAAGAGMLAAGCAVWGEDCGFAGIGGAFIGGILGFAGAFPYGVYRFGTDENYSGSLKVTYASALLGSAIGFGGTALVTRLRNEDAWFQSSMIAMAGAPIGALIGFNLARAPRKGVPQVSLAPMPDGGWAGRLVWNLR
ncbi:MAG: hypothetical protein JF616_20360 [Fibrobacteres bacterium]|nr:hypothetical protein [Fibrobacterota bacterium]